MKKKFEEQKEINRKHEYKIKVLERRIDQLLKKERIKNRMLHKVAEDKEKEKNLIEFVHEMFLEVGITIEENDIEYVARVGRKEGEKPFMITFRNFYVKSKILNQASKFKNSKIYVTNDLSKEQRQERNTAVKLMKELKKENKEVKMKGFNELVVEGKIMSI